MSISSEHLKGLGQLMKDARKRIRPIYSQRAMASAVGVIKDTIERWENGKGKKLPSVEPFVDYCRIISRKVDEKIAAEIFHYAYPHLSFEYKTGLSTSVPTEPSGAFAPEVVTYPGKDPFRKNMRIRKAEVDDARMLYETLCAAVRQDLPGDDDITPIEVFERWLGTGLVHFCIAETFDEQMNRFVPRGFYSVYPLTERAYEAMKKRQLHHDSIGQGDLVDGVFGGTADAREQKTILFVLDLEVIDWKRKKLPAAYLTIDLIDQIKAALEKTKVRAIAVLGATEEGKKWSEKLGFGYKKTNYFGLRHSDWCLYEMNGRFLKKAFGEAGKLGWRKIPSKRYPIDSSLLRPAITILDQLAGHWSER
jgi:DNA-binding XRE family transcriptional regulator